MTKTETTLHSTDINVPLFKENLRLSSRYGGADTKHYVSFNANYEVDPSGEISLRGY